MYLDTCEITDPDAGNCTGAVIGWLGCGAGGSEQVATGLMTFDPVQGQACLDALNTPGGCGDVVDAQLASACAAILLPNVSLGQGCSADINCLPPPDASYGDFGPTYGCDTVDSVNQLTCLGQCSYGHALGEFCGSGWNGAGCVQGQCVYSPFADGGSGSICIAPAPGDSCAQTGVCSAGQVCAGVEDGGDVCEALSGAGTSCNLFNATQATSNCASGLYCLDSGDGGLTGTCEPLGLDGGGCVPSVCEGQSEINCACDPIQSFCQPQDGGSGSCVLLGGVGTPCDPTYCPGEYGCSCLSGLACGLPADGGSQNICLPPGGVGAACTPGYCQPPSSPYCQCDPSQDLYCPAETATCQLQGGLDAACVPSDYYGCSGGLSCGQDVCIPTSPTLGQECAPNNSIDCPSGETCSDAAYGTCIPLATLGDPCSMTAYPGACGYDYQCISNGTDGGGVCAPLPAVGDDCAGLYTCRQLLTCANVATTDGGSAYVCEAENALGGGCDPNNDACLVGYCDPTRSVCVPFLAPGAPCDGNPENECGPIGACNIVLTDGGYVCTVQCQQQGG